CSGRLPAGLREKADPGRRGRPTLPPMGGLCYNLRAVRGFRWIALRSTVSRSRPMPGWLGRMFRVTARYARNGWKRGAANWFARSVDILCLARISIEKKRRPRESGRIPKRDHCVEAGGVAETGLFLGGGSTVALKIPHREVDGVAVVALEGRI